MGLYFSLFLVMKRVVNERTTDMPSLQYIFNMWTVSADVGIQRRHALAAALSPFMSLLYPPTPWCEWCDVWRFTVSLFFLLLFLLPFFNHERKRKAYVYVGPNMYRMTFVLTPVSHRGDRSRILGVRNKKACFIIIVPRENNMPICIRHGNKCKSCLSLTSARWNQTRLATTQQIHVHGLITI